MSESISEYDLKIKQFVEEALSCTTENKTLRELNQLLGHGAEIRIRHVDLINLLILKQQGIDHLNRIIDLKNQKSRFVISLISGFIGVLIGAAVSIVSGIIKCPPPC